MENTIMKKLRSGILVCLALMGFNALAISTPSITTCSRTSSTSVSLAWTSVSGASYYVVKRSYTTSVGAATTLASPTGTTYTDSQAGVDTCYYWVEAWDSSGTSARSSMATAASGSGDDGSSGGSFTINASDGTSTDGVVITWSCPERRDGLSRCSRQLFQYGQREHLGRDGDGHVIYRYCRRGRENLLLLDRRQEGLGIRDKLVQHRLPRESFKRLGSV